ncbi:MAG TPA: peptide deformylase, partial [Microbacteriaceae bacterium]|nr:peptide deformylase [Microbacteriaceae bacterium]
YTMRQAPGVGLAAPQIGVGLQVFVWEWSDDEDQLHEGAIVNP